MIEYEKIIVKGILQKLDYIDFALDKSIESFMFEDIKLGMVFKVCSEFRVKLGTLASIEIIVDKIIKEDFKIEKEAELEYDLEEFLRYTVKESSFYYSINKLKTIYKERKFLEKIDSSAKSVGEKGFEIAKTEVESLLVELDDLADDRPPEGDIFTETEIEASRALGKRRSEDEDFARGVLTGIRKIDETYLGIRQGECWMIAAYTGEGKTQICRHIAYDAVVNQGKNVVVVTTEMTKQEWKDMVECTHTHKFKPNGILFNKILYGFGMTEKEKKARQDSLDDLMKKSMSGEYGTFYLLPTKTDDNMLSIRRKLQSLRQKFKIDLCIIDYPSILKPVRRRGSEREEVRDILKESKELALTFNNGESLALLIAHQINRSGRDKAEERGYYVLNDLSDSSAAERNMNIILWLLRRKREEATNRLLLGSMKARRGMKINPFKIMEDYPHSYTGNLSPEEEIVV